MTSNTSPDYYQERLARRTPARIAWHNHSQPRRGCADRRARCGSPRRVRAERDAAGADRRASHRLCRHRRKGQTGRDFGSRQGGPRPAIVVGRRRQPVPARMPWSGSSAASARRRIKCPARAKASAIARGRSFSTGQGSGFFISADGYAVTNNHVVDKADSVEITTDDGKTYHRQGHRHRSAHRPGADQGRRRAQFPVRQAREKPRRASATGCWRSAIRSASAAP